MIKQIVSNGPFSSTKGPQFSPNHFPRVSNRLSICKLYRLFSTMPMSLSEYLQPQKTIRSFSFQLFFPQSNRGVDHGRVWPSKDKITHYLSECCPHGICLMPSWNNVTSPYTRLLWGLAIPSQPTWQSSGEEETVGEGMDVQHVSEMMDLCPQ